MAYHDINYHKGKSIAIHFIIECEVDTVDPAADVYSDRNLSLNSSSNATFNEVVNDSERFCEFSDSYVVLPAHMMVKDIVTEAIAKLNIPADIKLNECESCACYILMRNWKPLNVEYICDVSTTSLLELLGDFPNFVTLKIRFFRKALTFCQSRDKLLALLSQAESLIRSDNTLKCMEKMKSTTIDSRMESGMNPLENGHYNEITPGGMLSSSSGAINLSLKENGKYQTVENGEQKCGIPQRALLEMSSNFARAGAQSTEGTTNTSAALMMAAVAAVATQQHNNGKDNKSTNSMTSYTHKLPRQTQQSHAQLLYKSNVPLSAMISNSAGSKPVNQSTSRMDLIIKHLYNQRQWTMQEINQCRRTQLTTTTSGTVTTSSKNGNCQHPYFDSISLNDPNTLSPIIPTGHQTQSSPTQLSAFKKTTRERVTFDQTTELPVLLRMFEKTRHPTREQIEEILEELSPLRKGKKPLEFFNIQYWFKNARAMCKRADTISNEEYTNADRITESELAVDQAPLPRDCSPTPVDERIPYSANETGSLFNPNKPELIKDSGNRSGDLTEMKENEEMSAMDGAEEPSGNNSSNDISTITTPSHDFDNSEAAIVTRKTDKKIHEDPPKHSFAEKLDSICNGDTKTIFSNDKTRVRLTSPTYLHSIQNKNSHLSSLTSGLESNSSESSRKHRYYFSDDHSFCSPQLAAARFHSLYRTASLSSSTGSFHTNGQHSINLASTTSPSSTNGSSGKYKRNRVFIDPTTEIPVLEKWFAVETHPSSTLITTICDEINNGSYRQQYQKLRPRNIQLWFKNHRAKLKRVGNSNNTTSCGGNGAVAVVVGGGRGCGGGNGFADSNGGVHVRMNDQNTCDDGIDTRDLLSPNSCSVNGSHSPSIRIADYEDSSNFVNDDDEYDDEASSGTGGAVSPPLSPDSASTDGANSIDSVMLVQNKELSQQLVNVCDEKENTEHTSLTD